MKRTLIVILMFLPVCFISTAEGQDLKLKTETAKDSTSKTEKVPKLSKQNFNTMFNQMMLIFMERFKSGNYKEAKDIALTMIDGNEKYQDSPAEIYRSFATIMERRLFQTLQAQDGNKAKGNSVLQPIADGFYFLALLSFQEKDLSKALEYLQKAIQWNPVHTAFFIERGFILMHENPPDLPMAQISYLRALELADNYADFAAALRGVGFVLVEKGDYEGALACYLRARLYEREDLVATKEIDFIKSQAPFLPRDLDGTKAVPLLLSRRIPAGINPIHVKVLLSLAQELDPKTQPDELTALLKKALHLDPQNQMAKDLLSTTK